ncbi:MAG: methyltransferase domain-containing protein [Candidatus Helarchaeota archaeon]
MKKKPFSIYWAMPRPTGKYPTKHPNNIFKRINNEIVSLANKRILHLFCGLDNFGSIRIDINPNVKPDYILDLTKDKLPFKDGTFDIVYADPPYYDFPPYSFVDEAVRVLKTNGLLFILHQLVYKTPCNTIRYDLIPITTGPNMRMRVLNVFKKQGRP